MPTISVKDEVRLRELIPTVQSGRGSRSDVEALLVKIRQLAQRGSVLQDICNFATHPEGRDSGVSSKHLNTMYDRFRLLVIQQGFWARHSTYEIHSPHSPIEQSSTAASK